MSSPSPSGNLTNIPVDPTQRFNVSLQAQEWNAVLAAMSKATYEHAAPLIQAISQQLQEQASASPNGRDPTAMMHPN